MRSNDHLGILGENFVSLLFQRKANGRYRFSVKSLGAKAEVLDFLIDLLDDEGGESGPHFFVQVKTTTRRTARSKIVPAKFSAVEVERALARKVPVYLVAVECVEGNREEAYVRAVDATATGGISSVSRVYSLRDNGTRMRIYDEVSRYFESLPISFRSALAGSHRAEEEDNERP